MKKISKRSCGKCPGKSSKKKGLQKGGVEKRVRERSCPIIQQNLVLEKLRPRRAAGKKGGEKMGTSGAVLAG